MSSAFSFRTICEEANKPNNWQEQNAALRVHCKKLYRYFSASEVKGVHLNTARVVVGGN